MRIDLFPCEEEARRARERARLAASGDSRVKLWKRRLRRRRRRGRGELGRLEAAAKDLAYAGRLFEQENDFVKAEQLQAASERLRMETPSQLSNETGAGLGSALLGGTLSAIQSLAPIALKALVPLLP